MAERLVRKEYVIEGPEHNHLVLSDDPVGMMGANSLYRSDGAMAGLGTAVILETHEGRSCARVQRQRQEWYPLKLVWMETEQYEEPEDMVISEETWVTYRPQHRRLDWLKYAEDDANRNWHYDICAPSHGFTTRKPAVKYAEAESKTDKVREYRVVKVTTTTRVELDDDGNGG